MSRAGNAELLRVAVAGKNWPNGEPVLGPINFTLERGEVLAISGPSGCGKSTLLSIIAGLDHDYRGEVAFAGAPRLGVVFQTPRLLPWRTALQNVALGGAGGDPRRALAELGLAESADIYPARLSLGMAHRVALARALIGDPDLLLLDEALASLDAETAKLARRVIRRHVGERGMAVLMVSHHARDSADIADRELRLGGSPTTIVGQDRIVTGTGAGIGRSDASESCRP
jgi:ABC-type nitrate/sulfonate/bicarbonate transport system ATPase subunit